MVTSAKRVAVVGATGLAVVFSAILFFSMPVQREAPTAPVEGSGFTMSFYAPGIQRPPTEPASSAAMPDNEPVVGVSVKGHCRAYRLNAMCGPRTHVVNDVIERVPVTVTYCDLRNCVRAFTVAGEPDEPLDTAVQGLQDGKMRLSVNDVIFLQDAEVVPVDRLKVEVTNWKDWKTAHHETDIFVGDCSSDVVDPETRLRNFDLDAPGIKTPPVIRAPFARLIGAARVIGVSVEGHCRAYRVSAMSEPKKTVINDIIGGIPVTVTYNQFNTCVSVFTAAAKSTEPLDIGIGGWKDAGLLLKVEGEVFPQDSDEISIGRLEPEVVTWTEWKSAHPETDVFTGIPADDTEAAD